MQREGKDGRKMEGRFEETKLRQDKALLSPASCRSRHRLMAMGGCNTADTDRV